MIDIMKKKITSSWIWHDMLSTSYIMQIRNLVLFHDLIKIDCFITFFNKFFHNDNEMFNGDALTI